MAKITKADGVVYLTTVAETTEATSSGQISQDIINLQAGIDALNAQLVELKATLKAVLAAEKGN